MVHVDGADADVRERADAQRDRVGDPARDHERDEEAHRRQEETLAARLGEMPAVQPQRSGWRTQRDMANEDREHGGGDGEDEQRGPEPAQCHSEIGYWPSPDRRNSWER